MSQRPAISASRGLVDWLVDRHISLAFTTYQTGKLFTVGHNGRGQLSVHERTFERAMGLSGDDQSIWMASLYQLWRIENVLEPGQLVNGCDRSYVPMTGHTTGDLDIHDLVFTRSSRTSDGGEELSASGGGSVGKVASGGVRGDGGVVFVSARFSCLATLSDRYHFKLLWVPPFISRLAAEDRCHLNGLAAVDGEPRYVTACSQTDVADGWREHRRDGGVVIDMRSDEVICEGLSMPHSPRWHGGRLWLLDSGNGDFGSVDPATGRFEPLAFCPGFARGLAFAGDYAIITVSLARHERTFAGLSLDQRLEAAGVTAWCGLIVVNLETGDIEQWLRLDEPIRELYDVLTLPGVNRPRLVGFKTDEIRTRVWVEPQALAGLSRTPRR